MSKLRAVAAEARDDAVIEEEFEKEFGGEWKSMRAAEAVVFELDWNLEGPLAEGIPGSGSESVLGVEDSTSA